LTRKFRAVAFTMQGLVKYHGLRDWSLRLPFHDSISVNTTCLKTEASITDGSRGGVFIEGGPNESASQRLQAVVSRIKPGASVSDFRVDSRNVPGGKVKGVGYSSSAGAALTLLCESLLGTGSVGEEEMSRAARLFAASAARSLVGGFSRLYSGPSDEDAYAERFADSKDMDLRMVIVPLPSKVKTEDAHKEVMSSPFFAARVASAQKRCEEMEKAIRGNDLKALGVLAEKDTLELHSLTMTGESRMIILTKDSLRIIEKVRELRAGGTEAYFSMQTGPSVFVNTSPKDQEKVFRAVSKLGYSCYASGVGGPASLV
jgi:phosphomevalonate decarboxylase